MKRLWDIISTFTIWEAFLKMNAIQSMSVPNDIHNNSAAGFHFIFRDDHHPVQNPRWVEALCNLIAFSHNKYMSVDGSEVIFAKYRKM